MAGETEEAAAEAEADLLGPLEAVERVVAVVAEAPHQLGVEVAGGELLIAGWYG